MSLLYVEINSPRLAVVNKIRVLIALNQCKNGRLCYNSKSSLGILSIHLCEVLPLTMKDGIQVHAKLSSTTQNLKFNKRLSREKV